ncbi:MAG: hypothetical protein M1830_006867 [Pleopsidium flavum]|nr:MAG: hypothetical protein M1830_006867 [Pleopsidium flavum]
MPTNLTTTYLLPAILLNPVLFLHSINTILSRLLPPVLAATTPQPPPHSRLGPSATSPHLDMHVSDNLCWSYTVFMVLAQLVAFGQVSQKRQTVRDRKEAVKLRKEEMEDAKKGREMNGGTESNGVVKSNGGLKLNGTADMNWIKCTEQADGMIESDRDETDGTDETEGTEEEMML